MTENSSDYTDLKENASNEDTYKPQFENVSLPPIASCMDGVDLLQQNSNCNTTCTNNTTSSNYQQVATSYYQTMYPPNYSFAMARPPPPPPFFTSYMMNGRRPIYPRFPMPMQIPRTMGAANGFNTFSSPMQMNGGFLPPPLFTADPTMVWGNSSPRMRNSFPKPKKNRPDTIDRRVLLMEPPRPSTKPCNCRRSKCLKLYCDCFARKEVCGAWCSCDNCHNTELDSHIDYRRSAVSACIERNPLAFEPKVQSRSHYKGCHCRKSGCLKKYCECFEAGIVCTPLCKCLDCSNSSHSVVSGSKSMLPMRKRHKKHHFDLMPSQSDELGELHIVDNNWIPNSEIQIHDMDKHQHHHYKMKHYRRKHKHKRRRLPVVSNEAALSSSEPSEKTSSGSESESDSYNTEYTKRETLQTYLTREQEDANNKEAAAAAEALLLQVNNDSMNSATQLEQEDIYDDKQQGNGLEIINSENYF